MSKNKAQLFHFEFNENTKKKETVLDSSTNQNVFDMMQGVSIRIFVKKKKIDR